MKTRKTIALLIALPLGLLASLSAYISWLFPLKKGSKSSLFVPLWGKILLCRLKETGLQFNIRTPDLALDHDGDIMAGTQYSNDYFYLGVGPVGSDIGSDGVHTQLVTLQDGDIQFTYGRIFDDGYVYLTKKLYGADSVTWKLFINEYKKYSNEIKTIDNEQ